MRSESASLVREGKKRIRNAQHLWIPRNLLIGQRQGLQNMLQITNFNCQIVGSARWISIIAIIISMTMSVSYAQSKDDCGCCVIYQNANAQMVALATESNSKDCAALAVDEAKKVDEYIYFPKRACSQAKRCKTVICDNLDDEQRVPAECFPTQKDNP